MKMRSCGKQRTVRECKSAPPYLIRIPNYGYVRRQASAETGRRRGSSLKTIIASMASATTPRNLPTLNLRLTTTPSLPKPSTLYLPTNPSRSKPRFSGLNLKSIDVSKEDKPASDPIPEPAVEEDVDAFDKRRLEEKFAVLNTGVYECRSCGYRYDQSAGDPSYPVPPGLPFDRLPEDWRCPTCGAAQSFFQSKSVEIAGFAQNQQFGLGANTLTGGQKAILIYGSLAAFFVLFLSGYFLQ
ncbi:hypothetical protein V2J09_002326 [Rumex salicifolius]